MKSNFSRNEHKCNITESGLICSMTFFWPTVTCKVCVMSSKGSLPKIIFSLTAPSSIRLLESPNKIEGYFNIDVN